MSDELNDVEQFGLQLLSNGLGRITHIVTTTTYIEHQGKKITIDCIIITAQIHTNTFDNPRTQFIKQIQQYIDQFLSTFE